MSMRKYRQQFAVQNAQSRLEQLIQRRISNPNDHEKIDSKIWDLFGEEWAIMFTDLSGFSRNVSEFGIIHFLQVISESDQLFLPLIDQHDGFFLKRDGDSILSIFRNTNKAIQCSVEMQKACNHYNKTKQEIEKILLCVGLGYGKVLRIDQDVFGQEVNSAAKLGEDTAEAGEILVTEAITENCSENFAFARFKKEIPGVGKIYSLKYKN
jgi:class 3 adenylate cyclase